MSSQVVCPVCRQKRPQNEMFAGPSIRESLYPLIQKLSPDWTPDSTTCLSCLNKARSDLVEAYLIKELGELSPAERQVLEAIRDQQVVTEDPAEATSEIFSFGDRLADKIAQFGGSWSFIMSFLFVLAAWIVINTRFYLAKDSFDPYPFILLNLILSCVAAIQAPVIMMSQNRKEAKDRLQAELDYKTNLKAELEIRHLHTKVDQLLSQQQQIPQRGAND